MGIRQYLSETRGEMKHVSWPTRKQSFAYTLVVIVISVIVGLMLGLFDYALTFLLGFII